MKKGDLADAARTIELAMQKDPTLWLIYFTRARLFACEHKYKLAIEDCNWVLRKYPKFIEAALLRAESNAHLRRYARQFKRTRLLGSYSAAPRKLRKSFTNPGVVPRYMS